MCTLLTAFHFFALLLFALCLFLLVALCFFVFFDFF